VSKLMWRRMLKPLAMLVGGILVSGCGEENIPLKKVDMVLDVPKDFKETRKGFQAKEGSSAKIGHDPSGVAGTK